MSEQRKNRIKNLILLVLFVMMFPLTALAWLSYLDTSSVPEDSIFASLYQKVTYGVSGFEIRTGSTPAAMPTKIAIKNNGEMNGTQYNEASISVLYEDMYRFMGEAISASGDFEPSNINDVKKSLGSDGIYFGYEGKIPLSLIANWLGNVCEDNTSTDMLWLDMSGKLYIHTIDGYKSKQTEISSDKWDIDSTKLIANKCSFASENEQFNIRPDTIIFENDIDYIDTLNATSPDFLDAQNGESLTNLLSAFSYDLYVNRYEENQGETMVFVEDYSTLHVSKDGNVMFSASANEGGLDISSDSKLANDIRVQMDMAVSLIKSVQSSMGDTSRAMLYSISDKENIRIFTFVQSVGGIPVKTDLPFAQLVIQEGKLVKAKFSLKLFSQTGEKSPIIPSKQAAAASNNELNRLTIMYSKSDNMQFNAQTVYTF